MIFLSRHQDIGSLLRHLRHTAGLTQAQVAARSWVTKKAICSRELHGGAALAGLVDHARALGYRVALVPDRPGRRLTGTGWPT